MKTERMYEIDEQVMVRMIIADVVFQGGQIWYELRDPSTNIHSKYLYSSDMLMACDEKLIPKNEVKQSTVKKSQVSKAKPDNNK